MNTSYNKNQNLGSIDVKNDIFQYLYSKINSKSKHEIIEDVNDLDNIANNEYIICPRFGGTRSWIIFFQKGNNYYAVTFSKHNYQKSYIQPIDVEVAKDFYHGTIMEGIFFKADGKKFLVIDEVYLLSGHNQLLKPKDDRLNELSQYIIKSTKRNLNYQMFVNQYFNINKDNLKELYHKIKTDVKIQSLIFYPKNYGNKIYTYTILDIDLVDNIIKIGKFHMTKTHNPDVYNLFSLKNGNKIDIAYIPDIETSKRCKQWFPYRTKKILVKCQMNMENKKWVPVELVESDLENEDQANLEI